MAKESKKYQLKRGCLDILRPFLLAQAAYKDHAKAGALMVAAYGVQENQVSQFAAAKTDAEREEPVECALTEDEQEAVKCCLNFCLSNAILIPSPYAVLLIEQFLGKSLEAKDEKVIEFNVTNGGVYIVKQALLAILNQPNMGSFCWYKDEADKAMAVLRATAVLPKLAMPDLPTPNQGETEKAYDDRTAPLTDPSKNLSLSRSEADTITSALKVWVKNGVLQINKHTVKLIQEFSL